MTNKIEENKADTVLVNGRIATLDARGSFQSALAIKNGRLVAVGGDREIMGYRNAETQVIDVGGRTVIPGLIDSHNHFIREGLNYNLELRWDGVRSLGEGLSM
ncbi:MAG TPA: amidohydrolase family protein, partial [Candidatus Bathyarchaeia archaeon]|nr:amidohydrolase family protein [Candidatus Bathyarchaeia archaeon]